MGLDWHWQLHVEYWANQMCEHHRLAIDQIFDYHTLWITYQWIYIWFFMVYIPWRIYTGDVIYTIMDINNGIEKPMKFFYFLNILVGISNIFGYGMSGLLCK